MSNFGRAILIVGFFIFPLLIFSDSSSVTMTVTYFACNDSVDNDSDTFSDDLDAGCHFDADSGNPLSYEPSDDDEANTACSDLIDNDGDTFVDFGSDVGCNTLSDNDEDDPPPPPPSGGGGGGSSSSKSALIIVSGHSSPFSEIIFLVNGSVHSTTTAKNDGSFMIESGKLKKGTYTLMLYSLDSQKIESAPFSLTLSVTAVSKITLEHVILPPTFTSDKVSATSAHSIQFYGNTLPSSLITLFLGSTRYADVMSDTKGFFSANIVPGTLERGAHVLTALMSTGTLSAISREVSVEIGDNIEIRTILGGICRGDLNGDCRVTIVDFSILLFWFNREPNESMRAREMKSLSGDGRVTFTDLSILAYYWTG